MSRSGPRPTPTTFRVSLNLASGQPRECAAVVRRAHLSSLSRTWAWPKTSRVSSNAASSGATTFETVLRLGHLLSLLVGWRWPTTFRVSWNGASPTPKRSAAVLRRGPPLSSPRSAGKRQHSRPVYDAAKVEAACSSFRVYLPTSPARWQADVGVACRRLQVCLSRKAAWL